MPNFRLYFLVAQLSRFSGEDSLKNIEIFKNSKDEMRNIDIFEIIESGISRLGEFKNIPTVRNMQKIWDKVKKIESIEGIMGCTPIWENLRWEEMKKFGDKKFWVNRGIKRFEDIIRNGRLISFEELQREKK